MKRVKNFSRFKVFYRLVYFSKFKFYMNFQNVKWQRFVMHKFELQISKRRFQTNELKEKDTAACMQYKYIDL